ncbi:hypothetical protein [Nocardia stercoris]|nr:hypothetical protein [Nocardia stercoris]
MTRSVHIRTTLGILAGVAITTALSGTASADTSTGSATIDVLSIARVGSAVLAMNLPGGCLGDGPAASPCHPSGSAAFLIQGASLSAG